MSVDELNDGSQEIFFLSLNFVFQNLIVHANLCLLPPSEYITVDKHKINTCENVSSHVKM